MTENETKICLMPIEAQPLTVGTIISIMTAFDQYDEIIICVRDSPLLIDTKFVVSMASLIFRLPKFMVISHPEDFSTMVEFPQDLPFFNRVATVDERIYTNLTLKGYHVALLPRAIGYDDMFQRNAFRQGYALDVLRSRTKRIPFGQSKKTAEPTVEEGDD